MRTYHPALCTAFAVLGLTDVLKMRAGYALNHGANEDEIKEIAELLAAHKDLRNPGQSGAYDHGTELVPVDWTVWRPSCAWFRVTASYYAP